MDLIEFIEKERVTATDSVSEKYSALLSVLRAMRRGEEKMPVMSLLSNRWQERFQDFVTTGYTLGPGRKRLSSHTIKKHYDSLKSLARIAVRQRLIPNLKIFPAKGEKIEGLSIREIQGLKVKESYKGDMERLLRYAPSNPYIQRIADYLVLSILLCGIGLPQLLTMSSAAYDGDTLLLPHLCNVRFQVPSLAKILIDKNKSDYPSSLLFPTLKDSGAEGSREATILKITGLADWLLQRLSLSRRLVSHPFIVWLDMASQYTALSSVRRIVGAYTTSDMSLANDFKELLSDVAGAVAKDNGIRTSHWYAINSLHRSAAELASHLYDGEGNKVTDFEDLYVPEDILFKKKGNKLIRYNNPALDRIFFIKGTLPVMAEVQRLVRGEGIFYVDEPKRSDAPRKLSLIPEAQVQNLRRFLEKVDSERLYRDVAGAIGKKVRVKEGLYKGCEGVIVKYEGENPKGNVDSVTGLDSQKVAITYFAVRLVGNAVIMTPSIETSMVEEVI